MSRLFDKLAVNYDSEPRIAVAKIITKQVNSLIKEYQLGGSLLDFGCGTGLVGLELVPEFEHVYFTDTSRNMLNIVSEKIAKLEYEHAQTMMWDGPKSLPRKVDVVVASQVLLHIPNTAIILKELHQVLNHGGSLLIIDFDKNDLLKTDKIHRGFDQEVLAQLLKQLNFKEIQSATFHHQDGMLMNEAASLFWLKAIKS